MGQQIAPSVFFKFPAMLAIFQFKRWYLVTGLIITSALIFSECVDTTENTKGNKIEKDATRQFAGSSSCAGCHSNIYQKHLKTAHFRTSALANDATITGSIDAGKNSFQFSTGGLVKVEKRNGAIYQVAFTHGAERISQKMDIVTGSGTKGQTFLTWSGNHLFQLPLTYFTSAGQWANSPGNPNKIAINRPITSRCLECHTTFSEKISDAEPEEFNPATMILGVDCEKCHGPGQHHVTFQSNNPTSTKAQYILNPSKFTRQQSLDLCALCHGGRLQKTKPSFSFNSGEKLSDYFFIDTSAKDPNTLDVHGNQYGLLAGSKCFQKSSSMTCMTCHNVHENEKGMTALYSQRCISCHHAGTSGLVLCKLDRENRTTIKDKCTSCHMPELPSKAIEVLLQGDTALTPAQMHTHLIKNYPVITKKIMQQIGARKNVVQKHL